jgi:hypothetical protein
LKEKAAVREVEVSGLPLVVAGGGGAPTNASDRSCASIAQNPESFASARREILDNHCFGRRFSELVVESIQSFRIFRNSNQTCDGIERQKRELCVPARDFRNSA